MKLALMPRFERYPESYTSVDPRFVPSCLFLFQLSLPDPGVEHGQRGKGEYEMPPGPQQPRFSLRAQHLRHRGARCVR
jgi:hypothetical protein